MMMMEKPSAYGIGELRNGQTERTAEWANPVHTVICELWTRNSMEKTRKYQGND
jgi:hypothetical protein